MLESGSIEPSAIESVIPNVTKSYKWTLGDLQLNDAGDLGSDNYDIWYVEDGMWYKELR